MTDPAPPPDRSAAHQPPAGAAPVASSSPTGRVLGWLCLAPALILLVAQWLVPSLQTIWSGFQAGEPFGSDDAEFVGVENYGRVVPMVLPNAVVPLLWLIPVAVVVGLLAFSLAAGARGSGPGRWIARAAIAFAIAWSAPATVALVWTLSTLQRAGGDGGVGTAAVLGLIVAMLPPAIGVTAFGLWAALSGPRPGRTVLAVAVVGATVVLAAPLTGVVSPALTAIDRDGPVAGLQYAMTFAQFDIGGGAAIGTIRLVGLGVLGIIATGVVIISGLRGEVATVRGPAMGVGPIVGIVGAVVVVGITVVAMAPVVLGWGGPPPPELGDVAAGTLGRTWGPAALSATLIVVVSGLAGLGIGRLRPLGRHSGWLLLPFGPWLLTDRSPLAWADYSFVRTTGLLETPLALVPPVQVVPAVVVAATLLFGVSVLPAAHHPAAGRPAAQRTGGLVAAGLGVLWLLLLGRTAMSVDWPLLVATSPDSFTGPLLVFNIAARLGTSGDLPTAIAVSPVLLIITTLALVAATVATASVALTTGRQDDAGPG